MKLGVRTYNDNEYTDVKEWLKPSAAPSAASVPTPGKF